MVVTAAAVGPTEEAVVFTGAVAALRTAEEGFTEEADTLAATMAMVTMGGTGAIMGMAGIGATLVMVTDGDLISDSVGPRIGQAIRIRMVTVIARGGTLLTIPIMRRTAIHTLILTTGTGALPHKVLPRKVLPRNLGTTPQQNLQQLPRRKAPRSWTLLTTPMRPQRRRLRPAQLGQQS
jgi:hypothetical protein